jgi:hypothetical protein
MYVHTHTYTHTCMYIYIYIYIYIYTHTYIHTCIHTYMQVSEVRGLWGRVKHIASGEQYSACLMEDDSVAMIGRNMYGQHGRYMYVYVCVCSMCVYAVCVCVYLIYLCTFVWVWCMYVQQYSACLMEDGSVAMIGRNMYGQHGRYIHICCTMHVRVCFQCVCVCTGRNMYG